MKQIHYDGFELDHFDSAKNFRKYQLELIKFYLNGSLLEVGAGRGGFTNLYKAYSNKIVLAEPDKKLFLNLKKRFKKNKKIQIYNSKLKNFKKKYNTILYFDVLEHIKNDLKEVKNAKKKIRKGGYLIFNVPAHQQFYNSFDSSVGHFKRYNKLDFEVISRKAKLKIVSLFYYDSIGFFFLVLNKVFSLNNKNLKSKVKFWDFLIPISKMIDIITFNKVGKSLLCIYKKD